jgi:hypothetical protein
MANPRKAKGDKAEREAAALLSDLLGVSVRRKLGAGRTDDTGDLEIPGIPLVVQVADWADTARAAREKPLGAEAQAANAGGHHAATVIRFRGGTWRVVLTLEQFTRFIRSEPLIP